MVAPTFTDGSFRKIPSMNDSTTTYPEPKGHTGPVFVNWGGYRMPGLWKVGGSMPVNDEPELEIQDNM